MSSRKTTEEFITQAREIHGDFYDYSQVEYLGGKVKVIIICPKHGVFLQRPMIHTNSKAGCPICGRGGTLEERFWAKVNKNGAKVENMQTCCWEWIASTGTDGYGVFGIKDRAAHAFSYELAYGPIERDEDGKRKLWVLHKCDNRKCCRPDHLFLGTAKDNTHDAAIKGRLSTKMNPDKVKTTRELYKTGKYSTRALGKIFGVDGNTIWKIIHRRTWAHVE